MTWAWLDKPEQWDAVAKACYRRGVVGLDSETYGHNVKESTPAFRAQIDVWSLALSTDTLSPRGYHVARGCVLPREAALHPPMKAMLESPEVVHVFHNAHHDQHSFANMGVNIGKVYDTLDVSRLAFPEMQKFTLKELRVLVLGKPDRELFKELTAPMDVNYTVQKLVKACSCGEPKCRKTEAKWGDEHTKYEEVVLTTKTRKEPCPIESIVHGHTRWLRKLDYAGDDAVDALELREVLEARLASLESKLPDLPW